MSPDEVRSAAADGATVVDLRIPQRFAEGHLPGAVNVQFNRADLAERMAMVVPPTTPLVLHAEPDTIGAVATRILREHGFIVLGHLEGGVRSWRAAGGELVGTATMDVDELHRRLGDYVVLDVREPFEYRHGHIPGARLLPSTEAWRRLAEAPADRPLAVVCGDQVRSAFVTSLLEREGRRAALVLGGMADWLRRGYPLEREP